MPRHDHSLPSSCIGQAKTSFTPTIPSFCDDAPSAQGDASVVRQPPHAEVNGEGRAEEHDRHRAPGDAEPERDVSGCEPGVASIGVAGYVDGGPREGCELAAAASASRTGGPSHDRGVMPAFLVPLAKQRQRDNAAEASPGQHSPPRVRAGERYEHGGHRRCQPGDIRVQDS